MTTQAQPATRHPLDPLTAEEIELASRIVRNDEHLHGPVRFISVTLQEPPKEDVLSFNESTAVGREAFIILLDLTDGKTYESLISLADETVKSWRHIPGVQPSITFEEFFECERIVKADPDFQGGAS